MASYHGCYVAKKAQQTRDNILKAQKIKDQNQKKDSTKSQAIAGIIRTDPSNIITRSSFSQIAERKNYAQTVIEDTTKKTKYNEQQGNQVTDNSVEGILRQILNNQENFEKTHRK